MERAYDNNKHNMHSTKGIMLMSKNVTITTYGKAKRNLAFEKLCLMNQQDLKNHVRNVLASKGKEVMTGKGWVYAEGTFPVLLCAHLDTVHKELPKEIVYKDGKISSPQGIGGDDRCGVYMCLEILKKVDCHVVFFEDEEIGGVGSAYFCETEIIKNIKANYVIELDRANANDAVFYSQCNPGFENFITEKHWATEFGTFTDICNICPEMGIAGVNLSCGYYNQHTKNEYVVLKEMKKNIAETVKLLERTGDTVYEYIERETPVSTAGSSWAKYWDFRDYTAYTCYEDDWNDYIEYEFQYYNSKNETKIAYAYGKTEAEAFMDFMVDHPDVCYSDIIYMVRT